LSSERRSVEGGAGLLWRALVELGSEIGRRATNGEGIQPVMELPGRLEAPERTDG